MRLPSRRLGLGIALAIFQAAGGRCKVGAEGDRGCCSLEVILPRVTAGTKWAVDLDQLFPFP